MRIVGIIFAYITLILLILLCSKPLIRLINKNNKSIKLKAIQFFLAKKHVLLSILFLISFIIHVVCSTKTGFSLYTAKISVVFLLISILSSVFIKKNKVFLKVHYISSMLCLLMGILHILEVHIL